LAYQNAVSTYKETKIKTAGQGQLIIMLYDTAIRQLDEALFLLQANDTGKRDPGKIEKIGKAVVKTQEIISELMVSLDFEQGGEIAVNLFSLYTWFNRELMEANINQDARRILIVKNHIENLRNAWQEVVSSASFETASTEVLGVNIAM
jgi:flagellar secretion chaperone FliS